MGAITAFARAVTNVNAWIGRVVSYVVLILFVMMLLSGIVHVVVVHIY